jgi:hypothetical protein
MVEKFYVMFRHSCCLVYLQENVDEFKVEPHLDLACVGDEVDHHHSSPAALPVVKSAFEVW